MNDAPENDIVIFSHFSSKWQIKLFRKMEYCQDHEIYSLGMIAGQGSLPSEEAIKLIDAHLAAFKLDRNVTVCIANLTAMNTKGPSELDYLCCLIFFSILHCSCLE